MPAMAEHKDSLRATLTRCGVDIDAMLDEPMSFPSLRERRENGPPGVYIQVAFTECSLEVMLTVPLFDGKAQ